MFKSACPRVASLLVPRFPIVVARRLHDVPLQTPLALIKGEGSHARVAVAELHEHRSMAVVGWSTSRIRALLPNALMLPWNDALEDQLHRAALSILKSLESITPRCSALGLGLFTMEPFSYEADERGERDFATRTLSHMKTMEIRDVRMGVADAVITATAVWRVVVSQRDGSAIIADLMLSSVSLFSDPVVTSTFAPRARSCRGTTSASNMEGGRRGS